MPARKKDRQPTPQTTPAIPQFMRYNKFLLTGYRVNYSFAQLAKSMFGWHNQTVNIWTHLIPALVIFILIMYSGVRVQLYRERAEVIQFATKMQKHQQTISQYSPQNGSSIQESEQKDLLFKTMVQNYMNPISGIKKDIRELMLLTSQDRVLIKDKINHRHSKIQSIGGELDRLAMLLADKNQAGNSSLKLLKISQKLITHQSNLNLLLKDIIRGIDHLANQINPVPKWPILFFLVSVSIALTGSVIYHLFFMYSKLYEVLRIVDFSGVGFLCFGSSFPALIYASECGGYYDVIYLPTMGFLFLAAIVALFAGYFRGKHALVFGILNLLYIIPICHLLIVQYFFDNLGDPLHFSSFLGGYLLAGATYLVGISIMTYQCPERYVTGKFDMCGASHQIWHVLSVVGLIISYYTNWNYYYMRRLSPCPAFQL